MIANACIFGGIQHVVPAEDVTTCDVEEVKLTMAIDIVRNATQSTWKVSHNTKVQKLTEN